LVINGAGWQGTFGVLSTLGRACTKIILKFVCTINTTKTKRDKANASAVNLKLRKVYMDADIL